MGNHFKLSQSFIFGNFLGIGTSRPEGPVTTPKRVNESALDNPPKRPRTEDDAGHDVHSTPSSNGLPEKSIAASSSPQRKGAHDVLSLRSSADRSANGKGLEEYRNTEHRGGIGKHQRRRRKDKARRSSDGFADGSPEACLQETKSSTRYKSRNHLLSIRKPLDDPIQDDEEDLVVTDGPAARRAMINGRPNAKTATGNAVYTASKFTNVDESDDELNAEQPAHAKSKSQRPPGSISQVTNGRKRPTQSENDNESRTLPAAKRRIQSSNRADMRRTTFAPGAAQVGDDRGGLRVTRAVCGPSYVYPAEGGVNGASNKPCALVPSTKGQSPFEAVDSVTREPRDDLVWLTPKATKVTQISHARLSMTVKIAKSLDATAGLKTGPVLYLEFQNSHDAEQFVSRFRSVSGITFKSNMDM